MLASLRTVVGASMASLVLIAVVLLFVLDDPPETPDLLWLGIVLALGAVAAGLINTVGFRTPTLASGAATDDAARNARAAFQAGTIRRMAMAELPAGAALGLAFAAQDGGIVLFLLGAAISLGLLAVYVMPSDSTIARTQKSLEREGGRADLNAALSG